jgi:hypothetical protein
MSLSRGKPFSSSAWRGRAIFAVPLIEEITTKSGQELSKNPHIYRIETSCQVNVSEAMFWVAESFVARDGPHGLVEPSG